ncbi:hypothetical protein DICVIV_11568 [Dictyocaulus viviparus]|uniref:Uncharacterized protein n=1 Tax=Dictyocaulus viviparus TaxID=29172 RepID=A0A0D8XFD4_DICVI|nr:hypothetical protein DICVIV_11568 [Dictyocaulus viviparus]
MGGDEHRKISSLDNFMYIYTAILSILTMTCEKIGDPINSVISEPCETHHTLFTNNKIWLFGKKFVNQPSFNWGHNAALSGTYGVAFNISAKKWEAPNHTFPPMCSTSPSDHVSMIVADGKNCKTKYLISTIGTTMRVERLIYATDGATIEHFMDIPADVITSPSGQAVSAVETDGQLLIFYGVHGCGFRWDNSRMLACDLSKKTCQSVEARMTSSHYDGSIWGLQNLTSSPFWEHFRGEIPASMGDDVVIDDTHKIIYGIGKEGVGKVQI